MNENKLPRILILSSAENDENTETNNRFTAALNERLAGVARLEWHNYHDICLEMDGDTLSAKILSTGTPLSDFKYVYIKSYFRYHELACAIVEYLESANIPFSGTELRYYIPATKLTQLARLSRAGIAIPKTIYMSTNGFKSAHQYLVSELGSQYIFKAIDGSTGDDNYLIKSEEQLQAVLSGQEKAHFIAQNFIANESDMRVLIVGNEIKLVIDRRRLDDSTHLNNTSQGAGATLIAVDDLPADIQELSKKAAKVMNREVAGVDVMLETGTGKPYILEVNASPQIASGAFQDEKLDIYTNYFKDMV